MSANLGTAAPNGAYMDFVPPVICDAQIAVYNAASLEVDLDNDEPQVATRTVEVTVGVHHSDVSFENRPGNDETVSDPTLENTITTLASQLSGDETFSEDSQSLTLLVSGRQIAEVEVFDGFTQVKRRNSRNTITKITTSEVKEDEQQYFQAEYTSHPMITRSQ
ncbi:unnamed protein product [Cuscuta europaea]|uniref:Uncharacterized protein n=1 Tax=Cuscuta europaea TaxID=41803 RepID=A0A9P0YLY5_CUSEU|nr:unnamed protein product [Cuscuta europaea]